MRVTDLRTGYRCQNRCRFCSQGDARDALGDADTAAVLSAIRAIPHRDALVLAGGEVTLRPDLPELIAAARAEGFRRVGLQTNGRVLAARGAAESLARAGLSDVSVALHAPRAEIHDWLTQEPGSWRQAIAGTAAAVRAGITLRVVSVLVRSNLALAPMIPAIASRVSASSLHFMVTRERGHARAGARMLAPRLTLCAEAVARAIDAARELRLPVEVTGIPLCLLGHRRAMATDPARAAERAFALPAIEAESPNTFGAPCASCEVRGACPGVEAAYVARHGWGEFAPVGAPWPPPPQDEFTVHIAPDEAPRAIKQRLVQARASCSGALVLDGAAAHPDGSAIEKEALRLGFSAVRVG